MNMIFEYEIALEVYFQSKLSAFPRLQTFSSELRGEWLGKWVFWMSSSECILRIVFSHISTLLGKMNYCSEFYQKITF